MSADLRCTGCGETATRLATLKANSKVSRLTCEAGFATFDADLWSVRKLGRRDFGLPRGRAATA
jgi:hypothetical protein